MPKFGPTQKFRVILNGVSVFTTARTIRQGIGDSYSSNAAAQKALMELERLQEQAIPPAGLTGHWDGFNVQIDKAVF